MLWLLDAHPVTAAMLVQIGWFPTRSKALRRLRKLVLRRRIRLVGTVCRSHGRPEHVYCRWRPKPDQLLHEIQLTDFCLRLDAGSVLRGPHVRDDGVRPDAQVWTNGDMYYLEWDRGTMSYAQVVRHRFSRYADTGPLVLWVCPTDTRRDGLRARAGKIRHAALFATAAEALASPHGEVWLDHAGCRAALPRQRRAPLPPQAGTVPSATGRE